MERSAPQTAAKRRKAPPQNAARLRKVPANLPPTSLPSAAAAQVLPDLHLDLAEPGVHKDGAAQSIYQDLLATFFKDPAEAADRQVGGKAKAMGKAVSDCAGGPSGWQHAPT